MYTFDSRIRFSETDSEGKLTMASLINYFQDCSTFHSEDVGLGITYLQKNSLVWVLSSWQIVVERYPDLGENVTIGTQPYDMKGFLGYRNFWMMDAKGCYLAKANTLWSLLNTGTGKPGSIPEGMAEGYGIGEKLEMDYAPRKIVIPQGGANQDEIIVRKHHIDANHHVNNQQFVDMAMTFLPDGYTVRQLRAEYKRQAFLGDVLMPYVAGEDGKVVVSLTDQSGGTYAVIEFQGD
ncbi:MAG: acyl-[acyl-carrier-protein] thioesterase [Acetatifactor sp.]|nr:acyl-[acyl-carrier-protein] thioesterase [Acetatifactor sp.]